MLKEEKFLKKIYITFICSFYLISCGSEPINKSNINVVNGVEEHGYPAVVKISIKKNRSTFECTGTFIEHNILLTAAHCVQGVNNKQSVIYGHSVSNDIFANPKYGEGVASQDFALVKFPANTAPSTLKISSIRIADQDRVILVGYGENNMTVGPNGLIGASNSRSGIKRIGYNTYRLNEYFLNVGSIFISGPMTSVGDINNACTGSGDSGGPLIVEGKGIVGVSSQSFPTNGGTGLDSNFGSLQHINAITFFQSAKNNGFIFPIPNILPTTEHIDHSLISENKAIKITEWKVSLGRVTARGLVSDQGDRRAKKIVFERQLKTGVVVTSAQQDVSLDKKFSLISDINNVKMLKLTLMDHNNQVMDTLIKQL